MTQILVQFVLNLECYIFLNLAYYLTDSCVNFVAGMKVRNMSLQYTLIKGNMCSLFQQLLKSKNLCKEDYTLRMQKKIPF